MNASTLLHMAWRTQMRYRITVMGLGVVFIVSYGIRFIYLDSLYQFADDLGGWRRDEALAIVVVAALIAPVIDIFIPSIHQFARFVQIGRIEPHLVRPLSLGEMVMLRWSEPLYAILSSLVVVAAMYAAFTYLEDPAIADVLMGISGVVAAILCNISVVVLLYSTVFLVKRLWPVELVYSELFRLSLVPPGAFLDRFFLPILILLPIVVTASAPVAAFMRSEYNLVFYLVFTSVALAAVAAAFLRACLHRWNSFGG